MDDAERDLEAGDGVQALPDREERVAEAAEEEEGEPDQRLGELTRAPGEQEQPSADDQAAEDESQSPDGCHDEQAFPSERDASCGVSAGGPGA